MRVADNTCFNVFASSRVKRVPHLLRAVVVGCVFLSLSSAAAAQERHVQEPPPLSASHRFFDKTNIVLTGVEGGALLLDGIFTQRALTKYPGLFYEADPIARPFVSRGWPGQIVGGALFVSGDIGLRYWLHRKRHHRIERLLPLVLTVYGTVGAIQGARELARVERTR